MKINFCILWKNKWKHKINANIWKRWTYNFQWRCFRNIIKSNEIKDFILELLAPNVDARIFEIVSFSILKYFFNDQSIFWGFEIDKLEEENLKLYKTGRTNANDGGIDFVMKPLGRFFQVTETLDLKN